jgi:polyadenylate-binding protein
MRNKQGESLAFGFIHFASPEHGLKAIETYNGLQKEGKTMKVSIATPKHMRESRNLYISDLPEHVSELQLREVFEQYGHVFNCKLVINPETRKSRGFAFVLFSKASESEAAIQGLNSYRFSGAGQLWLIPP